MKVCAALIVFCLGLFSAHSFAEPPKLEPRTILALVSDQDNKTLIHRNAEMVLNYYGIKVIYRDIDDPLPRNLDDIRGILVWQNTSGLRYPKNFLEKFFIFRKHKLKIVFLGAIPGLSDTKSGLQLSNKFINERYGLLGIKVGRKLSSNPFGQKLTINSPEMVNFERKMEVIGTSLPEINVSKDFQLHVSVSEKLAPNRRADILATSPLVSLALNPIVISENPKTYLRQWTLNPFKFFKEAYDLEHLPRPDITTLNGRRMIYCHIDGDAFTGNCRFDKKRFCGEVVFDDVLKKYLFPHTLSLVHCWFDPDVRKLELISVEEGKMMAGRKVTFTSEDQRRWIKSAKRVFEAPWVEQAMHGYGHPLKWKREILALSAEGKPFSVLDEFDRSIELFSKYIIEGSKPRIFLWTGDCAPTAKQLAHTRKLGLINMNGGDTMFDSTHNSHTSVAPLYRRVGKELQVYASAANENIYTNEWAGPYYGFRNVIETFERTESPRRLAPVNIYYHWYSGEFTASMQALHEVYSWATKQPLVPIWGSRHIYNVKGFISCSYEKTNQGWNINNHNVLKTIRFDHQEHDPVVSKANNVIGFTRENAALYVHLGKESSSKIIWQKEDKTQPLLDYASCVVEDINIHKDGIDLKVWGYTPATISLHHLQHPLKEQKNVKIKVSGHRTTLEVHPKGHLILSLPWAHLN